MRKSNEEVVNGVPGAVHGTESLPDMRPQHGRLSGEDDLPESPVANESRLPHMAPLRRIIGEG